MALPLVSVVIDTYNHERFIERAVSSVLEQDFPTAQLEIIVIDDGSTDRTPEILKKFEDRVRVIRKPNGGQASAINAAISATSGDIVAFLDGDDWWDRSKLSAVVDAFEKYPEAAAVGHGYFEVPDDDPPVEMVVPDEVCIVDASSKAAASRSNLARTLLATSRLSVRRRVLNVIGPIPPELVFCADAPILSLTLALGGAVVLDRPLCYYRVHSGNLFTQSSLDDAKMLRKAEMLSFTVDYLRPRLREFGVSADAAEVMLEAYQIEADRLISRCGAGSRRVSAEIELRDLRATTGKATLPYLIFKALVGAMAFVLPGRQFNQLRDWYTIKNLKRIRTRIAHAEPVTDLQFVQRRPAPRPD